MKKFKSIFKSEKLKKVGVILCSLAIMAMTCISCFASEGTSISGDTVDGIKSGVSSLFSDIISVFSFVNLLQFIGIGIVASATIVLGYIGLRKLVSMITAAIRKGRMKTV